MDRKLWTEARAIAARHDLAERDDLAQDLALAMLERAEAPENPGGWLERVGRNAAIDRWRVDSRRRELLGDVVAPPGPPTPEAALLEREQRRLVRTAIAALPRGQRRAALARFHAGLSYDEAAACLGTEPATARTRVHRALAALRARLAALRAMFFFPGVQTATLGLALLVAKAPALPPAPIALDEGLAVRPGHVAHWAHARVIAAEAAAPRPRPTSPAPAPRQPDPPAVQSLVFDPDVVDGTVQRPDTAVVEGAPKPTQPSLIELRRHFVPELLKTLEDL